MRRMLGLVACLSIMALPAAAQEALPKFGEFVYVQELPEAIFKAPPMYPADARQARVEGQVMVQALVGKDGRVADARVVKSIPLLDAEALRCVRLWTFKPAQTNGQPVAVWVAIPIKFSLDGTKSAGAPPTAMPGGGVSCAEVLRHTPDDWMKLAREPEPWGPIDAADDWASCQRAATLERARDRAELHARLEALDYRLVEMDDALAIILPCGSDARPMMVLAALQQATLAANNANAFDIFISIPLDITATLRAARGGRSTSQRSSGRTGSSCRAPW